MIKAATLCISLLTVACGARADHHYVRCYVGHFFVPLLLRPAAVKCVVQQCANCCALQWARIGIGIGGSNVCCLVKA